MNEKNIDLGWVPDERTALGVARAVSRAIRDGVLAPGTKLPPIRNVAHELQLSPTTINSAWTMLARSGAIRTNGRRGTTVANIETGSSRYKRALDGHTLFRQDLSAGTPDASLLPDLTAALKLLTTTATPGGYLDEPVIPELVEVLRANWPYNAARFMLADGAMDALELATRTKVRFGDRVIVEDPAFPLLLDQLEAAGAEVVGVPIDEQGMCAAALAQALTKPAAAVFLQPRAQNPAGVTLSPARASELASIIAATDATVIEDDSAGAIASAPALSLGRWLPAQTLHIRSFSKSHGPDLRLAAMSGPVDTIQAIAARRQNGQGWSSRLLQRILWSLLTETDAIAQINHARREYARRREALVSALAEQGVVVTGTDGFNVWVPVADETAALVRLASQGIGAAAGAPFAVNDNSQAHIRLTISAVTQGYTELAQTVAAAARTESRGGGR